MELLYTTLLIDKCMKKATQSQLVGAIRKMRSDVRSKHDEIRSNTKVVRTLRAFLDSISLPALKKGEKSALDELREETRKDAPNTITKNSTKRTRDDAMSNLSVSDDEGPSKAQRTKVKKTTASGNTNKTGTSISKNGKSGNTSGSSSANARTARLAGLDAAKEKAGIMFGKSTSSAKTNGSKTGTPSSVPLSPAIDHIEPLLENVNRAEVNMILSRKTPAQVTQQQDWPVAGLGSGQGVVGGIGAAGITQPMQMLRIDPSSAGQVAQQSRPHSASVSRSNVPQPLQIQANGNGGSVGPTSAQPFLPPTLPLPHSAGMPPAPTLSPATTFTQPPVRQAQANNTSNGTQPRPEPNNISNRDNNNSNNNSVQGNGGVEGQRTSSAGSLTPDMSSRHPPPSPRTFHSGGTRFGAGSGPPPGGSGSASGPGVGSNDSRPVPASRYDAPSRSPYLNGYRGRDYPDRDPNNRERESDREWDRDKVRDRDPRDRPPPRSGGTSRPPPTSAPSSVGGRPPPSGPRHGGGFGGPDHVNGLNGRNRSRDGRDYRGPVGRDGPDRRFEDRDRSGNGPWPTSSTWNRR